MKKCRQVSQYTKTGKLVRSYSSIVEAENCTGICRSSISAAALKKLRFSGDYIWRFFEAPQLPSEEMPQPYIRSSPVHQYSKDGKYLRTFPSYTVAGKELYLTPSSIAGAMKHEERSCGGFLWRRYKVDQLPSENIPYDKRSLRIFPVSQYTVKGKLVKTHPNSRVASIETHIPRHQILDAAHPEEHRTAGGYIWRRYEQQQLTAEDIALSMGSWVH